MRVFVLGLDGMSFPILKTYIDKNYLPAFAALLEKSFQAELLSTIPATTPPAWTSMLTGMNPGKHGIFGHFDKKGYRAIPVTKYKGGVPIWKTLTQYGKKGIFLNIPAMFPPDPLNGIFVSGLMSPGEQSSFVYPQDFKAEIFRLFPDFKIDVVGKMERSKAFALRSVTEITKTHMALGDHILKEHPDWDLFFTVLAGPDRLQHHYYQPVMQCEDDFVAYYKLFDDYLASLLDKTITEETVLLIVSDHGFQQVERLIYLNTLLEEMGLLKFKDQVKNIKRYFAFTEFSKNVVAHIGSPRFRENLRASGRKFHTRVTGLLNKKASDFANSDGEIAENILTMGVNLLNPDLVDWSKTTAFSLDGVNGEIYINLEGREEQGVVAPRDYERVVADIRERLREVVDPVSGNKVFDQVFLRSDIYHGRFTPVASDIIVEAKTHYGMYGGISSRAFNKGFSGTHERRGILIGYGKAVEKENNNREQFYVEDITATILDILGLPAGDERDGRAIGNFKNKSVKSKWSRKLAKLTE